jgi:hypothetical protein
MESIIHGLRKTSLEGVRAVVDTLLSTGAITRMDALCVLTQLPNLQILTDMLGTVRECSTADADRLIRASIVGNDPRILELLLRRFCLHLLDFEGALNLTIALCSHRAVVDALANSTACPKEAISGAKEYVDAKLRSKVYNIETKLRLRRIKKCLVKAFRNKTVRRKPDKLRRVLDIS